MGMNVTEFATKIRTKYPQYAGLADEDLARKVVAKYPQYASQVDLPGTANEIWQKGGEVDHKRRLADLQSAKGPGDAGLISNLIEVADDPNAPGLLDYAGAGIGGAVDAVKSAIPDNPFRSPREAITEQEFRHGDAITEAERNPNPVQKGLRYAEAAGVPLVSDLAGAAANIIQPTTATISEGRQPTNEERLNSARTTATVGTMAAAPAALSAAPAIAKGVSPALRESAIKKYAKVIDPTGANPDLARNVASKLVDEGVVLDNPRADLEAIAEAKASSIDTTTPVLNRPQAARSRPIIEAIQEARNGLYIEKQRVPAPKNSKTLIEALKKKNPGAEVFKSGDEIVVRVIEHPNMQEISDRLHKLEAHIKVVANRGMLPNEALKRLSEGYNYYADKKGAYRNAETNPKRLPADEHVARAIRNVIDEDPKAAAANAEKSQWIAAKDDLAPKATQAKPFDAQRALTRMATKGAVVGVAGAFGGPAVAATVGKVLGAHEGVRFLRDLTSSPKWQTASAVRRAEIAKLLEVGDVANAAQAVGLNPATYGMAEAANDPMTTALERYGQASPAVNY